MATVNKAVQEAFVNILEGLQPDEDQIDDCILVAKVLGYTDKEIDEDLGLAMVNDEEDEEENVVED